MERHILAPLTKEQKEYCEQNHNLVYKFLHRFGYSIEEYYDIAVMGYIRACQIYLTREDLRKKYDFPFISFMNMRSAIGNSRRIANGKKHKPQNGIISLDADYAESENLYNVTDGKSIEMDYMEKESVEILLCKLSDKHRKIAELKLFGYSSKEIYLILGMKQSTYYKEVERIKSALGKYIVEKVSEN